MTQCSSTFEASLNEIVLFFPYMFDQWMSASSNFPNELHKILTNGFYGSLKHLFTTVAQAKELTDLTVVRP